MGGVVRSTFVYTPRRNSNNISVFLSQLAQITNELHHVNNTQHHMHMHSEHREITIFTVLQLTVHRKGVVRCRIYSKNVYLQV